MVRFLSVAVVVCVACTHVLYAKHNAYEWSKHVHVYAPAYYADPAGRNDNMNPDRQLAGASD
jgi:hypothetical protein